jgi:UDP-2-acetamido-3-amino-2,3-dideoxy-glucuronate N-acetyltransferase
MSHFTSLNPDILTVPLSDAPFVHSEAFVHPMAEIGDGTKVWAQTRVFEAARIGINCVLGTGVYVGPEVTIGAGTKVQNGGQIPPGFTVGRCVFWGPCAIGTNDHNPRADNPSWQLVHTTVEDGASIGAGAIIIGGNTIGQRALVGAGALVTRPVPPYGLVLGAPGRHVGWVNDLGERISSDPSQIPEELHPILKARGLLEAAQKSLRPSTHR